MGYYDVAQVCLNGHVITDQLREYPQHAEKYCSKCGVATMSQCPSCKTHIRGDYRVEGVFGFSGMDTPPAYCHECGTPYPWTEENLKAARELIDMALVTDDLKQLAHEDLNNLITDTPRTKVAATKIGLFLAKAGPLVGAALKDILIKVASESAKNLLFPNP